MSANDTAASRAGSLPGHWPRLLAAVERPDSALAEATTPQAWAAYLDDLWGNGLFPLAHRGWREAGVLEGLPDFARAQTEGRMVAYRAGWCVACDEIERALRVFTAAGLAPVLLKGAHLALCYYPEPHLRPVSDLDVLFDPTSAAEAAYARLESAGFQRMESHLEPGWWSLSQHLPPLWAPRSRFPVEIHGALVYSPQDDRWRRGGARLLERRRGFEWKGLKLEGLGPEALAVHLCGHMWQQHAGEPLKAVVLYDLRHVLRKEGDAFDWQTFASLAHGAGFAGACAAALRCLGAAFGEIAVPAGVLAGLEGERPDPVLDLEPGAATTQSIMARLAHAGGWKVRIREGARIVCPPSAYLRVRYPEKAGWPVWRLRLHRWTDQTGKVIRWAAARARGAKREQPS